MFRIFAKFIVRFRYLVILFWLIIIPVTYFAFPSLSSVTSSNNTTFLPATSASEQAQKMAAPFLGVGTATSAKLVVYRESGPLTASDFSAVLKLERQIKTIPSVVSIVNQSQSNDNKVRTISIGFTNAAYGPQGSIIVKDIRSMFNSYTSGTGLSIHLGGDLATLTDSDSVDNANKNNTQLLTVIFIIILLFIVYRSLVAPFINLIPALISLIVAGSVIAESTKLGLEVSSVTQLLLIVLILGAGTDYGLFLIFRFKEELVGGLDKKEAVIEALAKVGKSITFSGLTVIAALMCLLIAKFGFYRGLGPSLSIGVAITLLAALTLLPAILSILGEYTFWPLKIKYIKNPKLGIWGKVADGVIKKPWITIAVATLIFGALILGTVGWRTGGFVSGGPSSSSDSAKAVSIIDQHFSSSINNPQVLLLKYDKSLWNNLSLVTYAQSTISKSPLYKIVKGPIDLKNPALSEAQISKLYALLGPPNKLPFVQPTYDKVPSSVYAQYRQLDQFISGDGHTMQFYAVLAKGTSNTPQAANQIPAMRTQLATVVAGSGASAYGVLSQDAFTYDIDNLSNNDLIKIIPLVLIVIALLLAILLRSLIAPIYLVITVGLTYLASLGFANIVFVHMNPNSSGINFVLPFLLFVFSMALGEDYNILVMNRIREETTKVPTLRQAITKAIGITGTTVTSAGLILSGTFVVLAIVGGSSEVEQIGYSIAFGIALDTFFVRTLLVPSIAILLGRFNWWPSKLSRK
ncbi:MAG: MMPL family transporter [bacterium]